jgi:hypothetical protein
MISKYQLPCHHMLEKYLDEYVAAAEIVVDTEGPLFRTTGRKTGQAHAMWQQDAYRMIQRRAGARGHQDQNRQPHVSRDRHTAYLKNKGLLEHAQIQRRLCLAHRAAPK